MNKNAIKLNNRGFLYLSGEDIRKFLQNLITNNTNKVKSGNGLYTALLTPQGKYLFDFFLVEDEEHLILDCHINQTQAILQKLNMYKLRADVQILDISNKTSVWSTTCLVGSDHKDHITIKDPRHQDMGYRLYLSKNCMPVLPKAEMINYETRRINLGIPEGPIDLEEGKRFIMEANFEELNGLDFTKGCYVGQEINARMKYRGTLKKRIIPVKFEGEAPQPHTSVMLGDKVVGEVLSGIKGKALAILRLERLKENLIFEDGRKITPIIPNWLCLEN